MKVTATCAGTSKYNNTEEGVGDESWNIAERGAFNNSVIELPCITRGAWKLVGSSQFSESATRGSRSVSALLLAFPHGFKTAAAAPSSCLHTRVTEAEGKGAGKRVLFSVGFLFCLSQGGSSQHLSEDSPYGHQAEPVPTIAIILSLARVMGLPQEAWTNLDSSPEAGHVATGREWWLC